MQGHIVVEVCDLDSEPLVRMVGGSSVETVVSHDIIGRLMIQCARQPGLATVWEQLMGFDGGCSHDGLQGDSFAPPPLLAPYGLSVNLQSLQFQLTPLAAEMLWIQATISCSEPNLLWQQLVELKKRRHPWYFFSFLRRHLSLPCVCLLDSSIAARGCTS